jgi:ABC-type multidrug transport system ATPase subunit
VKDIVLSIQQLTKHYGSILAVDRLDLEVERGSVFGILGPNGSGKTTTLGIVLDVIRASSGSYSWFGNPPSKEDRKRIGAILEVPIFYPYLSAYRNLELVTRIKGISPAGIDGVLEVVGLLDRRDSHYRTYSLGMKQRLAIGAALLGNPEVLILDEPTNGLDPKGIAEIRNIIIKVAKDGTTIILASHILDEVQKTCSHVAVLERGKRLFSGRVDEVLNRSNWVEIAAGNNAALLLALKNTPWVSSLQEETDKFVFVPLEAISMEEINRYFFEKGIVLNHLALRKKSLENYFLELLDK